MEKIHYTIHLTANNDYPEPYEIVVVHDRIQGRFCKGWWDGQRWYVRDKNDPIEEPNKWIDIVVES